MTTKYHIYVKVHMHSLIFHGINWFLIIPGHINEIILLAVDVHVGSVAFKQKTEQSLKSWF